MVNPDQDDYPRHSFVADSAAGGSIILEAPLENFADLLTEGLSLLHTAGMSYRSYSILIFEGSPCPPEAVPYSNHPQAIESIVTLRTGSVS